jgi:hypothetical protein
MTVEDLYVVDLNQTFFLLMTALRNGIAMMEANPTRPIQFRVRFEMKRPSNRAD